MANRKQAVDYEKLVIDSLETLQRRTGWMRRQVIVALSIVGILAGLVCVTLSAEGLIAVQAGQATLTPSPTLTLAPLPTSDAQAIESVFKQAGFLLKNVKMLAVPNANWRASQGIQFTVQQADKHGAFLVLSYSSIQSAELDAFTASNDSSWKNWHTIQLVNLLVLGNPNNDTDVETMVEQELTRLLVTSHRTISTLTLMP